MTTAPLTRRALLHALALAPALPASGQALPMRTSAQSGAPVKYDPGNSQRPGLCMEVLRAIERVDPGLRFSGMEQLAPLRRIERQLAQGEIDVFFCLINTPQRSRRWNYLSVPLYRVRHMVVQRRDDASELAGWPELRASGQRKPVLVAQGSVLAQTLADAQVPFSDVARSDLDALRMLLLGRSDAVYGQDMTLLPLLREPELAGRLRLGPMVFQEDIQYAAVSRQLPAAAVRRLQRALQTLESEGLLRALSDKYRQP
jgi:polar amino acid transport system substrate-binding protein